MAERSGFYDSVMGDRRYNADDMAQPYNGLITNGIYAGVGEALKVTKSGTRTLRVGTGRAWINSKWYYNDSPITFEVPASDPNYDRVDLVVLVSDNTTTKRSTRLELMQGTPAQPAVPPTVTDTADIKYFIIARLLVIKNSAEINSAYIIDLRGEAHCPYVSTIVDSPDLSGVFSEMRSKFDTFMAGLEQGGITSDDLQTQVTALNSRLNTVYDYAFPGNWGTARPLGKNDLHMFLQSGRAYRTTTEDMAYRLFDSIPSMHNILYRGNRLGTVFTQEQRDAIRLGTFNNLWLGDYWVLNGHKYIIMGFNYWKHTSGVSVNHVVLMPENTIASAPWHTTTAMPADGIMSSRMYTVTIPTYVNTITSDFGVAPMPHVEKANQWNAATHYPSGSIDVTLTAMLPTPGMLGLPYQAYVGNNHYMASQTQTSVSQLPAVRMNQELLNANAPYWLQFITLATNGNAYQTDGYSWLRAVNLSIGVRPVFAISPTA